MAFPYPLIKTTGQQALAQLQQQAAAHTPVLLGDADDLARLLENYATDHSDPATLISAALALNPEQWLAERAASDPEAYAMQPGDSDWPADCPPLQALVGHQDVMTGHPLPEVSIALLPQENAWQAPCLLKFGGWNNCPSPEEHAALFRYWQQHYGAQLVTLAGDTLEMTVTRPPTTRAAALALAQQHYVYCPDTVEQGCETLEALAASLLNAPVWFFWWD